MAQCEKGLHQTSPIALGSGGVALTPDSPSVARCGHRGHRGRLRSGFRSLGRG